MWGVLVMNDRFFIHQITVYHTEDDEHYTKMFFDKVYFRHNKKTNLVDKGFQKGSTGSITIPTKLKLNISTNDYVVEGLVGSVSDFTKKTVQEVNNILVKYLTKKLDVFNLSELQSEYQVFKVVSVDDNRKGNLQHYKIGVSE